MVLDALEYLSQTSKFRVSKVYEDDAWGRPTSQLHGYEVTMPSQMFEDGEIYALANEDGICYRIRGGGGYESFDVAINIEALKELIDFCKAMTKGETDGR